MPAQLKSNNKLLCTVIIFIYVVISFTGCKGKTNENKLTAQQEKVLICIGGAPGIPILLAYEQGLFSSEGLEVTLKKYRTGAEGFEGFLNGECDMVAMSETSAVFNSFDRQDFSILANIASSDNSARILVDRKSGIKTPRDLRGKRIFLLKGSSNHYFFDMYLLKNNLTSKDVHMVDKKAVPDVSEAFRKRIIDVFCATDIVINKPMKDLGNDAIVFDSPDLCNAYFQLAAMKSFINARPATVRKALAALLKSENITRKDPGPAIKIAAGALGIAEKDMSTIWANYRWEVSLPKSLLLSLEHEAQWAIRSRQTKKTEMPNYMDFVHADALQSLKPEAVTMFKSKTRQR